MKNARLFISLFFLATLGGAVGIVALNSQSQELQLQPVQAATKPKAGAQKVVWEKDFETAMQKARSEGKPILIDFYTDWCGWCKEMDKTVYPDATVAQESRNWVMVKINGDKRRDVAQAYGVSGFPTVVFAEASGKPLEVVPGFANASQFVGLMRGAYSKWTPPASA